MATPLRVLIIEDVEEDADLLIRELKKGGYDPTWERVETAEALRDALKEKAWDCIFCDYNLPLFSGPEALELFKKTGLTTPFVLVSGAVGEDAAVEIVKAGADDFLLKGNWTRLISIVERERRRSRDRDEEEEEEEEEEAKKAPTVRHAALSLRRLLAIAFGTLIVVALAGWTFLTLHQLGDAEEKAVEMAEQSAMMLAIAIFELDEKRGDKDVFFDKTEDLIEFIKNMHEFYKQDIVIVDLKKNIVADAVPANNGKPFDHDRGNEVGRTLADGFPRTFVEVSADYPAGIKQLVTPIRTNEGKIVGALIFEYTAYDSKAVAKEKVHALINGVFLLGFILLAAGAVYLILRSVVRPVDNLRRAAFELGSGRLDRPVTVNGPKETTELAGVFENMRRKLKEQLKKSENIEAALLESNRARQEAQEHLERKVQGRTAELAASRARMQHLLAASPAIIYSAEASGDYAATYVSPNVTAVTGWRPEEFTADPSFWLNNVHPEDRTRILDVLPRLFAQDLYAHEYRFRFKDGRYRWMRDEMRLIRDRAGNPLELVGFWMDIGERREMEEELRQAKETLEERVTARTAELGAALESVKRRSDRMALLGEMGGLLQTARSLSEANTIIEKYLERMLPGWTGALYLAAKEQGLAEAAAKWGERGIIVDVVAMDSCWALRRGRLHLERDPAGGLPCDHTAQEEENRLAAGLAPPGASLCLPLTAGGDTLGIMHLRAPADDKGADPIEEAVTLIQTAAEQIALSLANIKLREDLRRQSIHDALTGLFNRRYLDETLPRETLRSKRGGEHLSVIMLDIDHFKKFNDEFGHEAGDLVLQTLGAFLKKGVRGGDIACRYGGEEFTVILPGASPEAAIEKAEKLRTGILTQRFIYGGRDLGKVTLSLGVATFPLHGETPEEVIAAADAALYRAKESGRNRVLSA